MLRKKNKYASRLLIIAVFVVGFLASLSSSQRVYAADPSGCPGVGGSASPGTICSDGSSPNPDPTLPAGCPGSAVQGPPAPGTVCAARPGRAACIFEAGRCVGNSLAEPDCTDKNPDSSNCQIVRYIRDFTRVLSGIVGVVIVIMIAVGGVQYSSARDNPQAVAAARGRIINALLALVLYMFSFALLQWLVPGGIL